MSLLLFISIAASVSLCICDLDTPKLRVFPAPNQTIAGVFQVSYVNDLNQVVYAFNASDARSLCQSLGANIASISQVDKALTRGLETCRFGWTDENLAVVPRITALSNCGKNQTGLVRWRAALDTTFDAFCFNETDTAALLDPTTMPTQSTSLSSLYTLPTSQPIFSTHIVDNMDSEAEKALSVGSAQGSSGKKIVVITSVVAVLLVAIVAVVYIKVKCKSDKEPCIEKDEWTQVKYTESKKSCSTKVDSV